MTGPAGAAAPPRHRTGPAHVSPPYHGDPDERFRGHVRRPSRDGALRGLLTAVGHATLSAGAGSPGWPCAVRSAAAQ